MKTGKAFRKLHALWLIACATSAGATLLPQGLTFGPQPVGTTSNPQIMTVYNTSSRNSVTVNSVTITPSVFTLVGGTVPLLIPPGQSANYMVVFSPDAAKNFTGEASMNVSGVNDSINLYGAGINTSAAATLSATSLNFANQPLGTSSSQTLVISNTGVSTFKVTGVTVTYPFSQTGFTGKTKSISSGHSLTLQVTFFPTFVGASTGTISITYDQLPPAGVTLSGTGIAATSFGVGTFPTLPTGTQSAAYHADLEGVGGVAPLTWSLASGSNLPLGLALSSSGTISGTLNPSVAVDTYTFTVQVTDSNTPPSSASSVLTLPISAPTGANCNDINFDIAGTTNPLVAINDLGTNYYLGVEEGGLYANGSNTDDPGHHSFGVNAAAGIQPLDSNGNPSSSGKYVFLSVGPSVTQQAFAEFMALANSDGAKNSNLVLVNGAEGGATALEFASQNLFWAAITNNLLPNAGVTAKQVVVAWVNATDAGMTGTFPADMAGLQSQLESIAQNLLTLFPNIKIVYYSSMPYMGYSNGVVNLVPEPLGYETGFAVKNAIQDQVNGNANLNYDPSVGPVLAPWIDWGPYYWANGLLPRSDGLVWTCQDYVQDGTHPSNPVGEIKVATQLLNFLKAADTATPWFLAAP